MTSSVHEAFTAQVELTPDATAVVGDGFRLTYREIDERANRLARRIQKAGIRADSPVGVLVERSPETVVAFLAVLKAGGCYLPLHDQQPKERHEWILEHAGATVLLTGGTRPGRLPALAEGGTVVDVTDSDDEVGDDVRTPVSGTDLAYVMYTSGSTGEPKGVAVEHAEALAFATDPSWDPRRHARVLLLAPAAFDVSVYEVLVPLLHGGTVVVPPPGPVDIPALRHLLTEHDVTAVHLTAGWFRVVAEEAPDTFAGVLEVLTGGDVVAPTAVERVLAACPDLTVTVLYGTTETTVFSTRATLTAPYRPGSTVSAGTPFDGVALRVLDEVLDPVPVGVVGELYLGGRGLARGYVGRPELTSERFVADPHGEPGTRMYRTGDLVRRSADGAIEVVGRADDLVKILGFRIEPAEIEAVLATADGVAHVAVAAREAAPGDVRLVAYVVGDEGGPDLDDLRARARDRLPDYMLPAAYVVLDGLPLTENGKVDRAALPTPEFTSGPTLVTPRDETETVLCRLYAEVLGLPEVGIEDSFFDLGGYSVLAMRLLNRVRAELGVTVPISKLFDTPTVAGIAAAVRPTEQR